MGHWIRKTLLVWVLALVTALPYCAAQADEQGIHALRSAYLYYFSYFIEWPRNTNVSDGQFNLCAFTSDPRDRFQLSTIEEKSINNLKLNIQYLSDKTDSFTNTEISNCHLIYFNERHSDKMAQRSFSYSSSTLVITEGPVSSEEELARLGDIHLFQHDNRLNFEIKYDRLQDRGFKASSKLLRLSKPVVMQ